jgi:hypothetical protein
MQESTVRPKGRKRYKPNTIRSHLAGDLGRSGRGGEDLVFGRTTEQAFYASTVDYRAKRAWRVVNKRATEQAGREGGVPKLL